MLITPDNVNQWEVNLTKAGSRLNDVGWNMVHQVAREVAGAPFMFCMEERGYGQLPGVLHVRLDGEDQKFVKTLARTSFKVMGEQRYLIRPFQRNTYVFTETLENTLVVARQIGDTTTFEGAPMRPSVLVSDLLADIGAEPDDPYEFMKWTDIINGLKQKGFVTFRPAR